MPAERSVEDIRNLANRFRGMLSDRETQAMAAVRSGDVKQVGAPGTTPGTPTPAKPDNVAERYRALGDVKTVGTPPAASPEQGRSESKAELGQLRPSATPAVPKQQRGLSR